MAILHELHERGRTIAMVTHEPDIAAHTQRIIHLRDGLIERIELNGHHYKNIRYAQPQGTEAAQNVLPQLPGDEGDSHDARRHPAEEVSCETR